MDNFHWARMLAGLFVVSLASLRIIGGDPLHAQQAETTAAEQAKRNELLAAQFPWNSLSTTTITSRNPAVILEYEISLLPISPSGIGFQHFILAARRLDGKTFRRSVEIEVDLSHRVQGNRKNAATATIIVPAGRLQGATDFITPIIADGHTLDVRIDGYSKQEYTTHEWTNQWTVGSIVLIGDTAELTQISSMKDFSLDMSELPGGPRTSAEPPGKWLVPISYNPQNQTYNQVEYRMFAAIVDAVPQQPIELSTAKFYIISDDSLARLTAAQSKALASYVQSGGGLLLMADDVNAAQNQLERWVDSLELSGIYRPQAQSALTGKPFDGVTPAKPRVTTNARIGGQWTLNHLAFGNILTVEEYRLAELNNTVFRQATEEILLGLGSELYSENSTSPLSRWMSTNFWKWNLVEFSSPPLFVFLASLVSFAAILVPGILIYCVWTRRPSQILVLLPLCSVVSVIFLFGYATLRDGFTTRKKTLALSYADLESGHGYSVSRQTLYSPIAGGRGIELPNSTLVGQISEDYDLAGLGTYQRKTQQRITNVIVGRTQQQFVTLQPLTNFRPISQPERIDAATLKLDYHLSSDASLIAVTDAAGNLYTATDVSPGKSVRLQAAAAESAALLSDSFRRVPLDEPAFYANVTYRDDLFEYVYNDRFQTVTTPNQYWVLTSDASQIDPIVADYDDVGSYHIITGRVTGDL